MGFKLDKNFDKAKESIERAIRESLNEIGLRITADAQTRAPVDTGNLRRSMAHEVEGSEAVYIGTNVEYAPDVEFGTSRQRAQPFLKDTFIANSEVVKRILADSLKKM